MVAERLDGGDPEQVWAPEVRELARACDAVICNLECCISERGRRTQRVRGKPFFFRAPPAAVRSLAALGVRAVGLANNHALDFETEALLDTLELLDRAGIAVAGAGAGCGAVRGSGSTIGGDGRGGGDVRTAGTGSLGVLSAMRVGRSARSTATVATSRSRSPAVATGGADSMSIVAVSIVAGTIGSGSDVWTSPVIALSG
jgi:poly-gamma-glutamate capsule biosynthesis protein CapA/YwtB (metallophosphatase superfamily)